jgi:hypothetical protein
VLIPLHEKVNGIQPTVEYWGACSPRKTVAARETCDASAREKQQNRRNLAGEIARFGRQKSGFQRSKSAPPGFCSNNSGQLLEQNAMALTL